jgi:DNA-binding MurR/RpiR family transcriptional regulator
MMGCKGAVRIGAARNGTDMAGPLSFDDLKNAIAKRQMTLPARLRQIADFAVHHPNEMALGTVAGIARRARVQPSSIVRFANAFGYEGFSALQQVFRTRLVEGAGPSYRERIAAMRDAAANGSIPGGPGDVLARFVGDGVAALEHLHESIREADLKRAIRLLSRADNIYLLGQGRSFPVAFYLHYAVRRLDLSAHLIDGVGGTTRLQAGAATGRDALVAISFKDYSPDVVALAQEMQGRGLSVIAITDGPLSPLAAAASITFELHEDETHAFRSLVAPMCLAQSLVVALGHRIAGNGAR